MNRTLTIAGAAALLMTLAGTGCTDPTVAPKSTVTSANIFNDPNSYRAFLAKIYGGLIVTGQRGPPGHPHTSRGDEGVGGKLRLHLDFQGKPTDQTGIGWDDPPPPRPHTRAVER